MTWVSLLQFPGAPDVPGPVRGGSFAVVYGALLGSEGEGRALSCAPCGELGSAMDTFAVVPPAALGDMAMDPLDPLAVVSATALLSDLPSAGVDDLVAVAGSGVRISPGDGAAASARRRPRTPVAGRPGAGDAAGQAQHVALGVPEDEASAGDRQVVPRVRRARRPPLPQRLLPRASSRSRPTRAASSTRTTGRLRQLKALYDPSDLFKGNHHHIPPAELS
jgi:hypothetical protein